MIAFGGCHLHLYPPDTQPLETSDNYDDHHHHYRSVSPCRRSFDTLSDVSQSEFNDTEILHLQERASRLLPRGEGLLSDGSIPVSSEGVGTSELSSPVNEEEPVQRYSIPSLIKPVPVKSSSWKSIIPPLVAPTRPQEDILFQWRSRRRMEQARDWSQPPSSWNPPSLSYFSAKQSLNTQALDIQQRRTPPHITASPPQTSGSGPSSVNPPPTPVVSSVIYPHSVPHVPTHMHYLCDVLPCPIQSSGSQQNTSQQLEKPETRVIHKKTQTPENCSDRVSDVHLGAHLSSSPSSSRALEGNLQTVSERNKKEEALREESVRTEMSVKSKKTSKRVSSHRKPSKNVTPRKEQQHQLRGNQENLGANCSGEPGAPHSPVHSALGKVVSEVFFPTEDLSDEPQRSSGACVPSRVPAPSLSSLPPCNSQNSVEVISQLLQEAEDSDEKEFEDDPLLKVLRKQRRWVKGQIRQVDSVLNEVLEKQQVT
ncbi:proline and serine-rich protein 3 [Gouania willdenowi]|uniref:proline and serine-rich protein 3 n=1 Tax=Gouania willdenowi TaxID=441366 RepID=UPI00105634F2|nr:proline and serine-rich protein 3 [Gouania willdenowi]XP_028325975.1 proline and serine-rich protein 3 [Gouania willdenowi]XP_028325976.1 proline and serine-rich protein 3 [Gouania willdenowi]XP_028325977.1 proline and serine-rich protein 3 [Gouania willdenowi]XP_028325978.1 proline and serine-rich protein 3 [Gouania willdenowi]XP_028325979.1 proline and serine-rich protein 3 [Gouania willdenowi]XP_028325980.1 proline and serine-rich protein 3 [Gouania willdenowi]